MIITYSILLVSTAMLLSYIGVCLAALVFFCKSFKSVKAKYGFIFSPRKMGFLVHMHEFEFIKEQYGFKDIIFMGVPGIFFQFFIRGETPAMSYRRKMQKIKRLEEKYDKDKRSEYK